MNESHYYPYGLTMAGISSQQAGNKPEQKYKYNSKELQHKEFSNGTGLEWYDYGARMYDVQIGRFFNLDRYADKYFGFTPFQYTANNPIRFLDANGDSIIDNDAIVATLKSFLSSSISTLNGIKDNGSLPDGVSEADINSLITQYQGALGEIGSLEKSDQIYNVFYNGKKDEGGTSYNSETEQVDVGIAKSDKLAQSFGLAGHELKHAYQFETGKVSFPLESGKKWGALYDLSDEREAYNRQAYLENGVYFKSHLLDNKGILEISAKMQGNPYNGLPSGPIDINSKIGKNLRLETITAGMTGAPFIDAYKGFKSDYNIGRVLQY